MNDQVTIFLDELKHPLRTEIELLRTIILNTNNEIVENIKWNGPNYVYAGIDRITMRIQPIKNIQLIFHRGAKVLEQPQHKLIEDSSGLLLWKTNDRAIATFKNLEDINAHSSSLADIVNTWLKVN
jgi:hypothetical protein